MPTTPLRGALPVGRLSARWSVAVGDELLSPTHEAELSQTAVGARWARDAYEVELRTQMVEPSLPAGMSVDAMVIGYWSVAGTTSAAGPPSLRCELVDLGTEWKGGPSSGEFLDAIEMCREQVSVCIGTPDSEWLHSRALRGDLPPRWADELPLVGHASLRDPVRHLDSGLELTLPELTEERAAVVMAVAVKAAPEAQDSVDTWYAINVAGQALEHPATGA